MSFRVEEKIFIKSENLIQFKEYLNKKLVKKIYHPRVIESIYFDNLNLDMHVDSIEGLTPRKKIRIRKYPREKDTNVYLEIKHSTVEGRYKSRKIINNKEYNQLQSNGILDNQYGICNPKLYVKYLREYMIYKDVRISIDNNIEYKDYKTNFTSNDNRTIVELKTSYKKNLDDLYSEFPFQRIRFSKYCFAVEKLFNKRF